MGRLIILTDLDDTLFSSERSSVCRGDAVRVGARSARQEPASFQSPQQQLLSQRMVDSADVVVPVTGRTSRALAMECVLGQYEYAVASHGAWVMHNGSAYAPWLDEIDSEIEAARSSIESALKALPGQLDADQGYRWRSHTEGDDIPVYISIKTEGKFDDDDRESLSLFATEHDLRLHCSENNAALLPSYASKRRAAQFFIERVLSVTDNDMVLGIGDSVSDRGFMGLCDYALCPTRSRVWTAAGESY